MDAVTTTSQVSGVQLRRAIREPLMVTKGASEIVPPEKGSIQSPQEQMEEKTSNYSLHNDEGTGEQGNIGFTQVTVRINCPVEILLLIQQKKKKKKKRGHVSGIISPNIIAKEVMVASQKKILAPRFRNDGTIAVNVASLNSTNRLRMMISLVGIEVFVTVSETNSQNVGKINNIKIQYSDYELLMNLNEVSLQSSVKSLIQGKKMAAWSDSQQKPVCFTFHQITKCLPE